MSASDDPRFPPIVADDYRYPCAAGRTAFFGGRWNGILCLGPGRNAIANESIDPIYLCDDHFLEVEAAGLVSEPFIDPDEFARRERRRLRGKGRL